jgi:hypothetical protein
MSTMDLRRMLAGVSAAAVGALALGLIAPVLAADVTKQRLECGAAKLAHHVSEL